MSKLAALTLAAIGFATEAAVPASSLQPIFASNLHANGVTTTASGRIFMPVQPRPGSSDPQVIEVRNGSPVAFPDATWNKKGSDAQRYFIGVNSVRIDPQGALWLVDRGVPGIGAKPVLDGAKLVKIDLKTNTVLRIYDLRSMTRPNSFVDDIRFNGSRAYLTDAGGTPAIIVMDLTSGEGRRVLEEDPSVRAHSPLRAEGKSLLDAKGRPVVVNADQMEVSPDGRWFYYQPCSGGMSRIETHWLDDATATSAQLSAHVERFAETPSTGGTAIGMDGTIFLSDVDKSRILTISPAGDVRQILADRRLVWVDAMWIDERGRLLMPAAQLNRMAGLNGGTNVTQPPMTLYAFPSGTSPTPR